MVTRCLLLAAATRAAGLRWALPRLAALGVFAAALPAVAAPALTRGPYLQQVTTSSAIVVWRTSVAAACTLTATAEGVAPVTSVTPAGTQHAATLTGMAADRRYEYTIRSAGDVASGPSYFIQTAPLPGTNATQRFLVWGDSGNGTATQMAVAAAMAADVADFALVVGDIVYSSGQPQNYDPRYFTPYKSMLRHLPAWAVLGNHDAATESSFFDAWYLPVNPLDGSERYYSFDWGDIHFVALNSNQPFTPALLAWLAADLDASSRRWKMVFFHHTMYSCGSIHGTSTSLVNALGPVFEAHGVDLAFYGHDHHFERTFPMRNKVAVNAAMDPDYTNPGAPIYVISGAAGESRAASGSCLHTARAIATPSYVRASVTGDLFTMEAVGADGLVLDRMTLSKSGTPPPPPPVQTVTVVSPNGGETVTVEQQLPLQWTASGNIPAVRIELSRGGATGPWETLFASTANDGGEAWTASGAASANCWLRVLDAADGTPSDLSDNAFQIAAASPPPPPATTIVAQINFQPAASPVPPGYTADAGLVYDTARGFGWNSVQFMRARDMLPANPRDSFVDVTNSNLALWELALPNGQYFVSLTCGDPLTTGTHRVAVEGTPVLQDVTSGAGEFLPVSDMPVVVSDGRLTVQLGGSGGITHTKMNSILVAKGAQITTPYAVLSPGAGDARCLGVATSVHWSGAGGTPPLRVELSRAGLAGPWEPLLWSPLDDGQESWMPSGAGSVSCAVRLVDAGGRVLASSASPFSLVPPSLRLLTPNGGETWTVGSAQSFSWTSSCYAGDVRIEVSKTGAGGPWTTLIASTPNDGHETWTVRAEDMGWTHARIVGLPFANPGDGSDAAFHVVQPPVTAPATWLVDFLVTGAAPAAGHLADGGLVFSSARGYGWSKAVTTRQRNLLPGDCRDSFVQVTNNDPASWEIVLPNGQYRVGVTCGDPYTSGTHRVAFEGVVAVQDVYAVGGNFVTRTNVPVTVRDGRLTMTLGGNGQITSTKVDCLEIRSFAPAPPKNGPREEQTPVIQAAATPSQLRADERPVHGTAHFAIDLARAGAVRLAVYDVRGHRVAMLVQRPLEAGTHDLDWNATDAHGRRLPSGVYFARLQAPDGESVRRIVLVR